MLTSNAIVFPLSVGHIYDPAKVQALAAITPGNKMNANNANKKNECK